VCANPSKVRLSVACSEPLASISTTSHPAVAATLSSAAVRMVCVWVQAWTGQSVLLVVPSRSRHLIRPHEPPLAALNSSAIDSDLNRHLQVDHDRLLRQSSYNLQASPKPQLISSCPGHVPGHPGWVPVRDRHRLPGQAGHPGRVGGLQILRGRGGGPRNCVAARPNSGRVNTSSSPQTSTGTPACPKAVPAARLRLDLPAPAGPARATQKSSTRSVSLVQLDVHRTVHLWTRVRG